MLASAGRLVLGTLVTVFVAYLVANLVESEDPIMLEEEGDRFPAWGSMHASRQDIRPKPPIEEKQLVEPTYGKGDKVFLDP